MTKNPAGKKLHDLYLSSRAIYWSIGMSLVYCILYIYLMSYFAEYIAWGIIAVTQVGLFIGSGICFGEYFEHRHDAPSGVTDSHNEAGAFLAGGIVLGISALIFLCCICCGFNQLRVAINVVDASADFIRKTKRVILVPVLYFFIQFFVVITWCFCIACIWSCGDIIADKNSEIPQRKEVIFASSDKKFVYWGAFFMFFGLLWILAWIQAKTSFITMVAATSFYFNSNKDKEGDAEVGMGFKFAYMNHAGSLAFGALIVTIIQIVKIIFLTIAESAEKASGENPAVKCIVCCAGCIINCLERICDYINKAAYAYMAVSGDSFCTSAWNGFLLNLKHTLHFAWAKFLASGFIFIGKLSLVVLNCFSCYAIMRFITHDTEEVSSIASPMVIVALMTYISASVFLGLFDEAVLAMMTCLAIDSDLHGEPKYGPPTFHDALDGMGDDSKPKNAIVDGGWEKDKTGSSMV